MTMLHAMRVLGGVAKFKSRSRPSKPETRLGRFKRRAYSLVEILLGAAVLAAFIVRVYQSYAATSAADKFEDFNSEMSLIAGSVIQQFINAPDYTDVATGGTAANVITAVLPSKYLDNAGAIVSVYHGTVTLAPSQTAAAIASNSTANDAFTVTADTLPDDACIKAVGEDFGKNFLAVAVGATATSADPAPGSTSTTGGATSAVTEAANCNTGSDTVSFLIH